MRHFGFPRDTGKSPQELRDHTTIALQMKASCSDVHKCIHKKVYSDARRAHTEECKKTTASREAKPAGNLSLQTKKAPPPAFGSRRRGKQIVKNKDSKLLFAGEHGTRGAVVKHVAPGCYFDLVGIASLRRFLFKKWSHIVGPESGPRKRAHTSCCLVFLWSASVAPEMLTGN